MGNSADIRRENKKNIYRVLLSGEQYTKQQLAIITGLSVATCNTLLNDMLSQGIVLGCDKLASEVGRSSVLYQINDDYESYLAIHFFVVQRNKFVETLVFSASGKILEKKTETYNVVDYALIETIINKIKKKYSNLAQIIIGTPSIAEDGIIKHCDIAELENVPMKMNLEHFFNIPVSMENDMHHKAYGFCKKNKDEHGVITLGYFPSHIFPGTATIHNGMIIRGANNFAGMTGFLPYDISKKEQLAMLKQDTCIPFVAKSLCAIIVLLNPSTIVLTGDLINEKMLTSVINICRKDIPNEYMPEIIIVDNFDEYYYEGMFQLAVDRKEF